MIYENYTYEIDYLVRQEDKLIFCFDEDGKIRAIIHLAL